MTAELKGDTKEITLDAIGSATVSNYKSTIPSYISIFESLWKQAELYDQLKSHDEIQREFINMAIHEIRNPVQPILSITNILNNKTKDFEQKELLDIVIRNTKNLQKLTEDILDISKIERKSLGIEKDEFGINSLIKDTIYDFKSHFSHLQKKIIFETKANSSMDEILVYADKNRLNQALSNLISNLIKFISEEGTISIDVEVKR